MAQINVPCKEILFCRHCRVRFWTTSLKPKLFKGVSIRVLLANAATEWIINHQWRMCLILYGSTTRDCRVYFAMGTAALGIGVAVALQPSRGLQKLMSACPQSPKDFCGWWYLRVQHDRTWLNPKMLPFLIKINWITGFNPLGPPSTQFCPSPRPRNRSSVNDENKFEGLVLGRESYFESRW